MKIDESWLKKILPWDRHYEGCTPGDVWEWYLSHYGDCAIEIATVFARMEEDGAREYIKLILRGMNTYKDPNGFGALDLIQAGSIESQVPLVANRIVSGGDINVKGFIFAAGEIRSSGSIMASGSIISKGGIYAASDGRRKCHILCDGAIETGGEIRAHGCISVRAYIYAGGRLHADGDIETQGTRADDATINSWDETGHIVVEGEIFTSGLIDANGPISSGTVIRAHKGILFEEAIYAKEGVFAPHIKVRG